MRLPVHCRHVSRRHVLALSQRPRDRRMRRSWLTLFVIVIDRGRSWAATRLRVGYVLDALGPERDGRVALAAGVAGRHRRARMVPRLVPQRLPVARARLHADSIRRSRGLAPLGGVYGVSLRRRRCRAGALVALLFGNSRDAHRRRECGRRAIWIRRLRCCGDANGRSRPASRSPSRIVQGAVPQEMKWDQAQFEATLDLYRDAHAAASRRTTSSSGRNPRSPRAGAHARRLSADRSGMPAQAQRLDAGARPAAPRLRGARSTTTRCWRSARSRSGTRSAGSCR